MSVALDVGSATRVPGSAPLEAPLLDRHRNGRLPRPAGTLAGAEHRPARHGLGSEPLEPDRFGQVVVDRLHPAPHEVGLVPEPRSTRVAEELPPPGGMRLGAGPALEAVEVLPVLAHPHI